MGRPLHDLTGRTYHRWTVLGRSGSYIWKGISAPTWRVRCTCGTEKVVTGGNLRSGQTKSCGCLAREVVTRQSTKHGMYGTPEYKVWSSMIQRCTNPRARGFENYGARGIRVCSEWSEAMGFQSFIASMGKRPTPHHSLDRKNNEGNYEPSNCRWATRVQQAMNKRTSCVLIVGAESLSIREWAERTGLGKSTIKERLKRGWTPMRAISTPVH